MKIIHNTSEVIQLTPTAQRGSSLGTLNAIPKGAVAISGETIAAVGSAEEILDRYPEAERVDAQGNAVVPGFVDPHTHLVWAGDRAGEFEMRLQGKTYMEIMAAGGGILSTLTATRRASLGELVAQSAERAETAFRYGTTTMEAKSGYGLDLDTEFRQLEAVLAINRQKRIELVPTYMGAHAIPPEYKDDKTGYVRFQCEIAMPETRAWWLSHAPGEPLPFVDVFCERGVFELDETREILTTAAKLGFPLKLHADEFANIGGTSLAADLGAVSADHLVKTSAEDIRSLAASGTVAVSLPGTPFGLAQSEYTPAKALIAADGYLALASDLNPGTTWNESMQFIQALACRYLQLTPAQALAASTINSARAVSREAKVGSLTPGKQADLLILTTPDYRHLSYRYGTNLVAAVIKKGRLYPGH